MLELVRYQKKGAQKTVNLEKDILSCSQILQSEKTVMGNLGNIWKVFRTVRLHKKNHILCYTYLGIVKNIFQIQGRSLSKNEKLACINRKTVVP